VKATQRRLLVRTAGRGSTEITAEVRAAVSDAGVTTGLAVVYCPHTSCSLLVQENADPAVLRDLHAWLSRVAPDGDERYEHDAEGPDDMPAHLRAAVTRTSETIPVADGSLVLGRWQGVFLLEHRTNRHERTVWIHVTGE
jgi:secondary thiamine-phosphate synthase enzyme